MEPPPRSLEQSQPTTKPPKHKSNTRCALRNQNYSVASSHDVPLFQYFFKQGISGRYYISRVFIPNNEELCQKRHFNKNFSKVGLQTGRTFLNCNLLDIISTRTLLSRKKLHLIFFGFLTQQGNGKNLSEVLYEAI